MGVSQAGEQNDASSGRERHRPRGPLPTADGWTQPFFKNLLLAPRRKLAAVLLVVVIVLACLAAIASLGPAVAWAAFCTLAAAAVIALAVVGAVPAARVWCFESFFALFGFLGSNAYFALEANETFLKRGRLDRLLNLK